MLTEKKIIDAIVEFINRILASIWEDAVAKLLSASPVANFVDDKRVLIESIDPKRFEPKQLAAVVGVPAFIATFLCRIAARQGHFSRLTSEGGEAGLYSLTTTDAK